jgi:hypothetical protein
LSDICNDISGPRRALESTIGKEVRGRGHNRVDGAPDARGTEGVSGYGLVGRGCGPRWTDPLNRKKVETR